MYIEFRISRKSHHLPTQTSSYGIMLQKREPCQEAVFRLIGLNFKRITFSY